MKKAVSVIIPVYNVDAYLSACLDSVLSQSLENIEILCINDCSPDTSSEILAGYAGLDKRVVILDHEHNRGQAAARNTGMEKATGEYLFFLDPDDLLFANESLEHLYEIAVTSNADEVIGATLRWNELTEERLYEYHKDYLQKNLLNIRFRDCPDLRHNAIACNKLFKRAFLEENKIFFNTRLKKFEDNIFSWKGHLLARSISLDLYPTYLHRLRADEDNKSVMQEKRHDAENHVIAAGDMLDFLEDHPEFHDIRHHFDRYFFSWCYMDVQLVADQDLEDLEKKEFLSQYFPILTRVPASSLAENIMPARYRQGINLLQQANFDEAWEVFAAENFQLYSLNREIENAYGSFSWRITAFLRKFGALLKKYRRY